MKDVKIVRWLTVGAKVEVLVSKNSPDPRFPSAIVMVPAQHVRIQVKRHFFSCSRIMVNFFLVNLYDWCEVVRT